MVENQNRGFGNSKPMMFIHFVAFIMYGFLGCLFLFMPENNFFGLDIMPSMVIGGAIVVYACFRGWRGYRTYKVNKSSE